jgi:DNA-binding transcriptional LysR family regulator
MNLMDLGYFVTVAETANLRDAAQRSGVTAAALSKAMRRLEADLGTPLFDRRGNTLHLNAAGEHLRRRAGRLLRDAEHIRAELAGPAAAVHLRIAGPEALLSPFAVSLAETLRAGWRDSDVAFRAVDEGEAVRLVAVGECDIGIVSDVGARRAEEESLATVALGRALSRVAVGAAHPLARAAGLGPLRAHVTEVLEHPFVLPSAALLAAKAFEKTGDGWRDDVFPRRVGWRVDTLQTLASLVQRGLGIAFLPQFLVEEWGLRLVEVEGCAFRCEAAVVAIHARAPEQGWMNQFLARAFR